MLVEVSARLMWTRVFPAHARMALYAQTAL
eukprot:COSAG06_NODE_67336_length_252_cov_0.673203_1_plen_29_part_10